MRIYDLIALILLIITAVVIIWYIFGNSPTFEQSLLLLALTFLFTAYGAVQEMKGDFKNLKRDFHFLEESFIRLSADFKKHINIRHK